MSYHVHHIDGNNHRAFLAQQRRDPVTKEVLKAGDRVVICASCQSAFLEDSWRLLGEKHCRQFNTLNSIQSQPSNQRFSSAGTRTGGFRVTNTSRNSQSTAQPAAPPTPSFSPAAPILGGVFVIFLGIIFVSFIAFLAVKFGMSGNNNNSIVNSSNAFVNTSTNRIYSNNSTVNRNSSAYTNTNKVSNTNPATVTPSGCRLYNDKGYENRVYIRSDCDIYDCDTDASRIIESLPDNTPIRIVRGVSRVKSNVKPYSWIKVEIIDTGQISWVADSKIQCN